LSRLVAEIVRLLVTTLVILGIGMILGFRFHHGAAAAVLWVAIPVIFGVAFAALATAIALSWPKSVMVEALQPVIILGANFCTGFIPVDLYPDWVQPAVRYQPMSQAVDAMRGLSVGGPVTSPLTNTLLWCAGIFAVCLVPIIVGYRRASTSR
jgi:ABC-2 type transport system permease protein